VSREESVTHWLIVARRRIWRPFRATYKYNAAMGLSLYDFLFWLQFGSRKPDPTDPTLPKRRDIVLVDGDLDAESACRNFLGKTQTEAESFFGDYSPGSVDDLAWMGPVAFCFYVESAIRYVQSEKARDDSDFVAFLASTLEIRLKDDSPEKLSLAAGKIAAACRYVVDNWPKFEDGAEAYGDVRARYVELERRFDEIFRSTGIG